MPPLPNGFLEVFTSGRYHKDIKIQKILASNSKRFIVFDILKKWQIDDDSGDSQILYFRR